MLALGRGSAAGGALVLSAVGGLAAAIVGMILAQADSPSSTLLFATWQPLVGMALGRFAR
jgi:hypothetical protein